MSRLRGVVIGDRDPTVRVRVCFRECRPQNVGGTRVRCFTHSGTKKSALPTDHERGQARERSHSSKVKRPPQRPTNRSTTARSEMMNMFLHSSPRTRIERVNPGTETSKQNVAHTEKAPQGQAGRANVQETEMAAQTQARAQARKKPRKRRSTERHPRETNETNTSLKNGKEEDPQITNRRRGLGLLPDQTSR